MRNCQDEYPVLGDTPTIDLPPRSVLYRLQPVGLGTGSRESLVSYSERLLSAHRIPRYDLKYLPGVGATHEMDLNDRLNWAPGFLAGGVTTLRWVSLLEELTTYKGLEALTFLPIAKLVNTQQLVARQRRWCPECMAEATAAGVPYGQLLWHLACVNACPVHKLTLEHSCRCGESRTKLRMAAMPGHCARCGDPLAETLRRRTATAYDVNVARIAASLLGDSKWDDGGWDADDNHSRTFLRAAADLHFDGKCARLARALGVAKSSLHGWMSGRNKPSLAWLISVAHYFSCGVADILRGRRTISSSIGGTPMHKRRRRRPKVTPEERVLIAEQLATILASDIAEPLTKVSERLDVGPEYLRRHFSAECALIVKRYRAERSAGKRDKWERWLITVRKRAERLADAGILPTARRVLVDTSPPGNYREIKAEFNRILLEARKRMTRKVVSS